MLQRQARLVVLVELADDARPLVRVPVEEMLLDLVLDHLAPLFDDENFLQALAENSRTPHRVERPRHADLVEPQADRRGHASSMPSQRQRLARIVDRPCPTRRCRIARAPDR